MPGHEIGPQAVVVDERARRYDPGDKQRELRVGGGLQRVLGVEAGREAFEGFQHPPCFAVGLSGGGGAGQVLEHAGALGTLSGEKDHGTHGWPPASGGSVLG